MIDCSTRELQISVFNGGFLGLANLRINDCKLSKINAYKIGMALLVTQMKRAASDKGLSGVMKQESRDVKFTESFCD